MYKSLILASCRMLFPLPHNNPVVHIAVVSEKVLSCMMLYACKNGLTNQRILKQNLLSYALNYSGPVRMTRDDSLVGGQHLRDLNFIKF